jgi:diadenosine tetraphosphatase ApaH/serine/threonine PP2A family protein phosphatase
VWNGSSRKKGRRPALPQGIRIYAVGDVHGRADLLTQVMDRIDADLKRNPSANAIEVYLGDYIDRGPASRQVLDCLILRSCERNTVFLKGNHESYVSEFIENPAVLSSWRQYGGLETLMSYGLQPSLNANAAEQIELAKALKSKLPKSHREFLNGLQLFVSCGDFFFVHAGVKPRVPLAEQREEDLLWIRDDFLLCEDDFEKIVVHGHTPVREPDIRPNRINIDTGAYATGRLTCIVIEHDRVEVLGAARVSDDRQRSRSVG